MCQGHLGCLHQNLCWVCIKSLPTQVLKDLETIASEVDCRSLYAKPFALDAADLDKITAFFNKAAPVNCVRLRRHVASRNFRGSVFVEFASVEHATSVLAMKLEYDGAPVTMVRKVDYMAKVKLQRKAKKVVPGKVREAGTGDAMLSGVCELTEQGSYMEAGRGTDQQ